MTECEKHLSMLALPYSKLSHTELGIAIAQEDGFKCGWKEALKWTLRTAKQLEKERAPISMNDVIRGELNDERI